MDDDVDDDDDDETMMISMIHNSSRTEHAYSEALPV